MPLPKEITDATWPRYEPSNLPPFTLRQNRDSQYELMLSIDSPDSPLLSMLLTVYVVHDLSIADRDNACHNSYRYTVMVDGVEYLLVDDETYFNHIEHVNNNEDSETAKQTIAKYDERVVCPWVSTGSVVYMLLNTAHLLQARFEALLNIGVFRLSVSVQGWRNGPY